MTARTIWGQTIICLTRNLPSVQVQVSLPETNFRQLPTRRALTVWILQITGRQWSSFYLFVFGDKMNIIIICPLGWYDPPVTRSTSMVSDKFSQVLPGSGTNSPKTGGIRRSESAKDGASEGSRRNQRRGGVRKHSDPYQRQSRYKNVCSSYKILKCLWS